jgi:hypothetical protein
MKESCIPGTGMRTSVLSKHHYAGHSPRI